MSFFYPLWFSHVGDSIVCQGSRFEKSIVVLYFLYTILKLIYSDLIWGKDIFVSLSSDIDYKLKGYYSIYC